MDIIWTTVITTIATTVGLYFILKNNPQMVDKYFGNG